MVSYSAKDETGSANWSSGPVSGGPGLRDALVPGPSPGGRVGIFGAAAFVIAGRVDVFGLFVVAVGTGRHPRTLHHRRVGHLLNIRSQGI
jgi:hypothetical protein